MCTYIHTYIHTHTHTEGVQLLCLIDKGQDASRYLQTYGEWYHSVWLAKATLNEKDCTDVLLRWTDYLSSVDINQKVHVQTRKLSA